MTPAPALDLTTSLRGDLVGNVFVGFFFVGKVGSYRRFPSKRRGSTAASTANHRQNPANRTHSFANPHGGGVGHLPGHTPSAKVKRHGTRPVLHEGLGIDPHQSLLVQHRTDGVQVRAGVVPEAGGQHVAQGGPAEPELLDGRGHVEQADTVCEAEGVGIRKDRGMGRTCLSEDRTKTRTVRWAAQYLGTQFDGTGRATNGGWRGSSDGWRGPDGGWRSTFFDRKKRGGGGGWGWHKASVSDCLPLAAPIGLSPLHILTLCGPERVLVASTEPPDDLSCLTTPGVGRPGDGAVARAGGGGGHVHEKTPWAWATKTGGQTLAQEAFSDHSNVLITIRAGPVI